MAEQEFRVLLADDHPVVAAGLRLAIGQARGLALVGTALDPETLLLMAAKERPDAFILDLVFDGQLQFDLIERCRATYPGSVIIVFTSLPAGPYRQTAIAAGADAFVGKDTDLETLAGLLLEHLGTPRRKSGTVAAVSIIPSLADIGRGIHFTRREQEVAAMLSHGNSINDIARALGISMKTASVHRDNLRMKLQCRDSNELIARLARLYGAAGAS